MTDKGEKQLTDLMDSELAELVEAFKNGTAQVVYCNDNDSHWDDYEEETDHDCGEDACVRGPEAMNIDARRSKS